MNEKQIYALIDRFESSSLSAMEVRHSDFKIKLEKSVNTDFANNLQKENQTIPAKIFSNNSEEQNTEKIINSENEYVEVRSPIVGAFYGAPSPTDPPFVNIGEKVKSGQVLCLIEAMKMMNELTSPVDGIVKRIHGKNGELLEYDQVVFEIQPC